MSVSLRQSDRLGRLTTALGTDALVLLRFDGVEHLNELFEFRVEALATQNDVDFDSLIGTHATVEIEGREGVRAFDGIVTQARLVGLDENGYRYDLVLRPWFWLAGRRRNQVIFHNKTVVDIVEDLLAPYASLGDPALEINLGRDYPVLEYTVQYRESDLDFVRRQLERAGINFHFRHDLGTHTLVLTDDVLTHESIGARPFKSYNGHHQADAEHFWDWSPERNFTTGAIRLTDYNFKKPMQSMETNRQGDAAYAQGRIESFDYPGDYLAQDVGKLVAGLRTEQERGSDRRNRAVGDCLSLGAGQRVTLSGDPVPGSGESYLCLSAHLNFASEAYGSGGASSDGYAFTGTYTLMPDGAPMAPPRKTPLPTVQGPQTAVVVGEGEIDCDEYGRILVQFHWDLAGAYSMRCRVSQNWAGAGWGGMVIPRIGMEVVVEFLEGDPDKPLVIGCVYNGRNKVPYELPNHKTRSTFKSDTHEGQGFNEIRFEDEKEAEEIFVHAQRDLNTKIEQHRTERTNENKIESVGDSKASEIHNVFDQVVGGDMRISVGPAHRGRFTPADAKRETQGIGGVASMIGKNIGDGGAGNLEIAVERDLNTNIGRNSSETLGKLKTTTVGDSYFIDVAKNFVIEAGQQLTLRCGQSMIVLDARGNIAINGKVATFTMDQLLRLMSDFVKINE